jgi:hypothetical protein
MEDDLNIFENGRRPQFLIMEDDLKEICKWKTTSKKRKLKTTSIFFDSMEDDLKKEIVNGIQHQFFKENTTSKTFVLWRQPPFIL